MASRLYEGRKHYLTIATDINLNLKVSITCTYIFTYITKTNLGTTRSHYTTNLKKKLPTSFDVISHHILGRHEEHLKHLKLHQSGYLQFFLQNCCPHDALLKYI
jgi:hypothetical protein